MAVYHGKAASLYAWNGTSTVHADEECTEGTNTGQITDTAKRILDPNLIQPWKLSSKTDISFTASTKKINSVAGQFNVAALWIGNKFTVAGSTSNDGTYTVEVITANDITTVEALVDEGATAAVTIETRRPFTDSGEKNLIDVDYVQAKGTFDGTVTVVTADGKHILAANITEIGNLFNWSIETSLDLVEANVFGDTWKKSEAGLISWNGGAEGYFLNNFWFDAQDDLKMWFVRFRITAAKYFHGWCHIPTIGRGASVEAIVNKTVTIQGYKHLIAVIG